MARHLILAPHHDDAEFGLGVSMQRWLQKGDSVSVIIAAGGDYVRNDGHFVDGLERNDESSAAFEILGVKDWSSRHWFQENGGLEADYGMLVGQIEKAVIAFQATDTYVCLPSFNQDHRVLYDAAVTAFRPGGALGNLHAYEYFGNHWQYPAPNVGRKYVTATGGFIKNKFRALNAHRTQFNGRRSGVNPETAQALAVLRGAEIGEGFAEMYVTIKEVLR